MDIANAAVRGSVTMDIVNAAVRGSATHAMDIAKTTVRGFMTVSAGVCTVVTIVLVGSKVRCFVNFAADLVAQMALVPFDKLSEPVQKKNSCIGVYHWAIGAFLRRGRVLAGFFVKFESRTALVYYQWMLQKLRLGGLCT